MPMGAAFEADLLMKIHHPKTTDEESIEIAAAFFQQHAPSGSATRPFFATMIARICKNHLRPGRICNKSLAELTATDGKAIGASLSTCLFSNTESNTGVDEWVARFPALHELDEEYGWFRPFMRAIAEKLLIISPWGANLRMLVAGGMSVLDKASAIAVVWTVGVTSETGQVILGIMAFALLVECIVLHAQYKRSSWGRFSWEFFMVLTGVKVGVDSYRVAKGYTQVRALAQH